MSLRSARPRPREAPWLASALHDVPNAHDRPVTQVSRHHEREVGTRAGRLRCFPRLATVRGTPPGLTVAGSQLSARAEEAASPTRSDCEALYGLDVQAPNRWLAPRCRGGAIQLPGCRGIVMQLTAVGPYVLPLAASEATLDRVGGKRAPLARLVRGGLPVPSRFHVTTAAYTRVVEANGLPARIRAAAAEASVEDPTAQRHAAAAIAALFERGEVPEEVAAAVRRAFAELDGGRAAVAVRSPRPPRTCPRRASPASRRATSTCASKRRRSRRCGAVGARSGRRAR